MPYQGFQAFYQHLKGSDPRMFDCMNKISDYLQTINNTVDASSSSVRTIIQTYKQPNIPRGLGGSEKGLIIRVDAPYNHLLIWDGNKWHFADEGSNYIALFRAAPTGDGWQLCDGTSITFLKSDGTISAPFNIDNLSGNPAFLKAAAAYTGAINAAAPITISITGATAVGMSNNLNDADAGATVVVGAGATVALKPHTHVDGGHVHSPGTLAATGTPTGDPIANLELLPYFRR